MPTFKESSTYVMPIGKYKGLTVDHIAEKDAGLLYLDWLRSARSQGLKGTAPSANERELNAVLSVYLDDPTISKELTNLTSRN
jgi:hypothetical protein